MRGPPRDDPLVCSGGRIRTSDPAVTQTPRFPSGADYLFAIALQALGAGRLVSEPSRSVLRAWLRIAIVTTHRRFPAIHPVTPLTFAKGLPFTTEPLALPLSYTGSLRSGLLGHRASFILGEQPVLRHDRRGASGYRRAENETAAGDGIGGGF